MLGKIANARNEIKFLCIEELVPKDHLLRKIESGVQTGQEMRGVCLLQIQKFFEVEDGQREYEK